VGQAVLLAGDGALRRVVVQILAVVVGHALLEAGEQDGPLSVDLLLGAEVADDPGALSGAAVVLLVVRTVQELGLVARTANVVHGEVGGNRSVAALLGGAAGAVEAQLAADDGGVHQVPGVVADGLAADVDVALVAGAGAKEADAAGQVAFAAAQVVGGDLAATAAVAAAAAVFGDAASASAGG
jgi:hypothetical protein